MFYVDSQRTVTRRDSSLIVPERIRLSHVGDEGLSTARAQSTARLCSESTLSLIVRPKGSVQKELVTMLFESMLDTIVDSWEVIVQQKAEESTPNMDFGKTATKISKSKRSRSKMEDLSDSGQVDGYQSWWSAPDERALVRFRNGNLYEGNISMKCMHGEGRFQWADGTVYFGQFKDNEINGKGMIQWKDDTWYEGEFAGNLRHGHGLYVNSRAQRSYAGGWHLATKHGKGVIYYSKTFKNSYDGEWVHNVRHGLGSREYCEASGYKGEWEQYVREGRGHLVNGYGSTVPLKSVYALYRSVGEPHTVSPVKMRTKNPMAKKPQQILFSKNLYSPKTKVENWDFATHAETKDNYVYRDKLSNHMSTYNRWGTKDQGTGMTETRHMLAQVFTKTDPVYSFKPLVNFTSYPCTDTPGRNTLMKSANLAQLPPEFGVMDYMSTQQDDYRNPFPCLTMSTPTWLLNRVIRSDLTHNHGTAPPRGDYQCLDTHTPIGHIRQLRLFRYQSFDPATCLQSFPDVKINLNNNKNANDI
ncbi:hypothetical protein MSG28_002307 [Choristoneura fumiferana]|uniref:Uncharacterized protein n=1 Tax=Choristoneura fumiferana TaxID=7141 RepID=A0ACC0JVC4_CHOFU|nr:hypothetical protein MSG28_002307 [Choristoneura fumiferana]